MAEHSKIEWTDATWNPITGCDIVSPGCTNCYAMKLAGTRLQHHPSRIGLTRPSKAGPVWTGGVRFNEQWLTQPLQWQRPRKIFVCAHGDLFAEGVPDEWIDRVFAVMALASQHTFQVLTKRSERMREYVTGEWTGYRIRSKMNEIQRRTVIEMNWPLQNVWLGMSAEDQKRYDDRVAELRETPAAIRFVSFEPLLGPIDPDLTGIDWAIVGGESGPGARPMHPDWARSIRDRCAEAGVPFLFKQHGEWQTIYDRDLHDPDWRNCPHAANNNERYVNLVGGHGFHGERVVFMRKIGKKFAGRLLDGIEHNGYPEVRHAA